MSNLQKRLNASKEVDSSVVDFNFSDTHFKVGDTIKLNNGGTALIKKVNYFLD